MNSSEKQLLEKLKNAVIEMDEEAAKQSAEEISIVCADPYKAVQTLIEAMEVVGEYYDQEEYFIPEVLSCADAMYIALEILNQHIPGNMRERKFKIVIGAIKGDTHDIGKNIIRIFLESGGFEVMDLGRDVEPKKFVEAAKEFSADIIAISSLMTTTMWTMKEVIDLLKEENIREKFKVMVGGRPLSLNFAKKIGADGYSTDAKEALSLARRLVNAEVR